ncbi:MAG: MFS transporter [bacterium]
MTGSKKSVLRQFPVSFWTANVMEIFERMAWYGFFALSSIYITGSVLDGGLGFSSEDRGLLQGVVSFFVYLLPFLTGALADRYGYKKTLLIAYCILAPAYYLLGQMKTMPTFFAAFMMVGVGAAIFKPVVAGTIGRTTTKENGMIGFGIFYMMVNMGGLLGPFIAAMIRNTGWNYVFIASSIWISLNIPIVLFLYKEPSAEAQKGAVNARSFKQVMQDMMDVLGNARFFVLIFTLLTILVMGSKWLAPQQVFLYSGVWIGANLLLDFILRMAGIKGEWSLRIGNARFLLFLLLLSSFWVAFNQIFITLPEYIRDFCNTKPFFASIVAWMRGVGCPEGFMSWFISAFAEKDGSIKPEQFININAFGIIVFQVMISMIMNRLKTLVTIIIGILLTAVSFVLFLWGANPIFVIIGILVFSFGEMMASPTAKQYTAHNVAPQDRVGLYMGYYFWCNALGNLFGGLLSGNLYGWLARDLQRPDLMWLTFAGLSVFCAVCLIFYHLTIGKKIEQEKAAAAAG